MSSLTPSGNQHSPLPILKEGERNNHSSQVRERWRESHVLTGILRVILGLFN